MIVSVPSAAIVGLNPVKIGIEVDIPDHGFPAFTVVGLAGKAVKEACERVRSAIKNSGFEFPNKRITINLTPADLPKEGPLYDLPIALGILLADGQVSFDVNSYLFWGELSLNGELRSTPGALPFTRFAQERKALGVFLPYGNIGEAALIEGIKAYGAKSLKEILEFFNGAASMRPAKHIVFRTKERQVSDFDMSEVKGQEQAKRALEIAAAGNHNLLMIGPPGSGKTMLSRVLPTILPPLNTKEAMDVTQIYSIAGRLGDQSMITQRPFRHPHHSTSLRALIGGGSVPKPGEITLAHRGVLFLDEFLEFPRSILESMRQPLEDRVVTVSRVSGSLTFPAQFILVAAANPCPCGYLNSNKRSCNCQPYIVQRYQQRLSGPLLDRIDLFVSVSEVEVESLSGKFQAEGSEIVRARVIKARQNQEKRFAGTGILTNTEMSTKDLGKFCTLDEDGLELMRRAASKFQLSARAYFRVLKVARTIADLEDSSETKLKHLAEALQYRPER
jgi:magnesium chelatase family protein